MAYSIEIREKALEYLARCNDAAKVAEAFGIARDTVYVWRRLKDKTGSVAKKPVDCSKRRRIINDEVLLAYPAEHPDAYLSEMAALFDCSVNAVHKRLKGLNITRKKRPPPTGSKIRKRSNATSKNWRHLTAFKECTRMKRG